MAAPIDLHIIETLTETIKRLAGKYDVSIVLDQLEPFHWSGYARIAGTRVPTEEEIDAIKTLFRARYG